jgi:hypothetical protein
MDFMGLKIGDKKKWNKWKNILNTLVDAVWFWALLCVIWIMFRVATAFTIQIKDSDIKSLELASTSLWFAGVFVQAVIAYGVWQLSSSINRIAYILEDKKVV